MAEKTRMRVLSVHLHLTSEGVVAAVFERHWKGARPDDVIVHRVYLEGVNIESDPADIMRGVAAVYALQRDPQEVTPDP